MNIKESFNILKRRFEQKNILYVQGNVYDKFQKYENNLPQRELISLIDVIKGISKDSGYKSVMYFRPELGSVDLMTSEEPEGVLINEFMLNAASEIENQKEGKVYIIDMSEMFFSNNNKDAYINEIMRLLSAVVIKDESNAANIVDITNNSKVIFVMRDSGNMISEIGNKNNEFGQVNISMPDRDERSALLSVFANMIGTSDKGDLKLVDSDVHKDALGLTSGLSYKEILQLGRISDEDITFKTLVNISKFSKTKSEWEKLPFDRVKKVQEFLAKDVIGQEFATKNVERVLKNSLLGLNGAMNGENNKKPKGILFFAGPTGVGKTELAKSLARFVFNDESRMIRFDMSEFSQEHSDQRLIGAPPGYVGYDGGGELTNAVRDEPQSIILFDEIEKAHGKILDKFLQILEDGRLTSSQGELIDFSETFIIFTSNIGAKAAKPDNEIEANIKIFKDAVARKFKDELGRPEILNRIGLHNVIPFNFITDKEILKKIFRSKLSKLSKAVMDKHKININIDEDAYDEVFDIVEKNYDKQNGGRGLISAMEITIQNELTDFLFSNKELVQSNKDEIKNIWLSTNKTKIVFEVK